MKNYETLIVQRIAFLYRALPLSEKQEVVYATENYMGREEANEFFFLLDTIECETIKYTEAAPYKLAIISLISMLCCWYIQKDYYNPERITIPEVKSWFEGWSDNDDTIIEPYVFKTLLKYMYEYLYTCMCTYSKEVSSTFDIVYYLKQVECPELFSKEDVKHITKKLKPFLEGRYLEDYDDYESNLFIHIYSLYFVHKELLSQDCVKEMQSHFLCYYALQKAHDKDGINDLSVKAKLIG